MGGGRVLGPAAAERLGAGLVAELRELPGRDRRQLSDAMVSMAKYDSTYTDLTTRQADRGVRQLDGHAATHGDLGASVKVVTSNINAGRSAVRA